MEQDQTTRVLYNDACPVCRREIRHYDSYARARSLPLRFEDLNEGDLRDWGVDPDQAARRLHVLHNGTVHAGIPAFLVLWREMPRYRWLARVVALPGLRQGASLVYDRILAPMLYRWHLRRSGTASSARKLRP
ncbi:MAG: DUF393 domain-containing protein [Rhodobacteraceae bacterium]|nr:DUF393 domain-containing protein [Paracoccaceae bacterium]